MGEDSVGSTILKRAKHDLSYVSHNVEDGLPGLQREIHDTIWSVEHMGNHGVGSGMLIDLLLVALVYIGVGCAYKYQTMGARGIDMIPHIGFWMEYPQLVADGVKYSCMQANDCCGGGLPIGRVAPPPGFQGSSDRDTFAHFEP